MRKADHEFCVDVTKEFASDPLCGLLFLHPVDLGSEDANALYRKQVLMPMDLATVQARLKEKDHYPSVAAWAGDVALIFENAIAFNGEGSIVTNVARFFNAKLTKRIGAFAVESDSDYHTRLGNAVATFYDLLSRPPTASGLTSDCPPVETVGGFFDEYSLNVLGQKLNDLMRSPAAAEVAELLGCEEGRDMEVDLGVLDDETVRSLWAFVREKEEQKHN
jgi:hypothetical protein